MKKSYILLIGLISAILALILIPLFFYYASQFGYFFLDIVTSYHDFLSQYFDEISSTCIIGFTFFIILSVFICTLGFLSEQHDYEKRK
jgi:uncharacterized membrane protein